MTSRSYKQFWVWQFDREASYIQKMAHQGKRIIKTNGFIYSFEDVAPMLGTVQIDYKTNEDLPAFKGLLQDAGWQVLASLPRFNGAWLYCYNPDPKATMYSDNQSKISLLKQIRAKWTAWGVFFIVLELVITHNNNQHSDEWGTWVIGALIFVMILVYGLNFVMLTNKIHRLSSVK